MSYFVGAYAASPCHSEWNPEWEARYLAGLRDTPGIAGLELPFFGKLHRYDSEWLLRHLPESWRYVLTAIPGTMITVDKSPHHGLASADEAGRADALRFAEKQRAAVETLNRHFGQRVVRAVEVHAAPRQGAVGVAASVSAFARSLSEIAQWDWQGAEILVEHCDRYRPAPAPTAAKGFLSLHEEIAAIREVPAGSARLLINWGRSAIEERDPECPRHHLDDTLAAGVLGGVIFSGATVGDPLYGDWADSHAPFAGTLGGERSVMTNERVTAALRVAYQTVDPVIGFKVQALPKTLSVDERIAAVREWLGALQRAQPTAPPRESRPSDESSSSR